MTRASVPFSLREALTSENSEVVAIPFVTITHPTINETLRFVGDGVDYIRDGVTWTGVPFDIQLPSDNDGRPTAKLKIPNVDRSIGEAILSMGFEPCRVKFEILSSSDFNEGVSPRTEIGTADVAFSANHLFLVNVSMNALEVTGTLKGWDYTQEAYPAAAATKDRLPGLYW